MKPNMIVTMPGTGGQWFAECVNRANKTLSLYPSGSFFNPLANVPFQAQMMEHFACEAYMQMPKFGEGPEEKAYEIAADWMTDAGYNLCVEEWMTYNLDEARQHFNLLFYLPCMFTRTFPSANDVSLKQKYDMMFQGMIWNDKFPRSLFDSDFLKVQSDTYEKRAALAWAEQRRFLERFSARLKIPCVYREDVLDTDPGEFADLFRGFPNSKALTYEIVTSREYHGYPGEDLWAGATNLVKTYQEITGD